MHSEYLTLLEDAIRQPDLAKSMQRYQLAVHIAKVHLDLAACPGRQQAEVNKPKKKSEVAPHGRRSFKN